MEAAWSAAPQEPIQMIFESMPKKSTAVMSYDYAASKRSLDCLLGLSALGKIKILVQVCTVRAQVPPSREETGRQNHWW
ncbi:hypothetical protein TNCV_3195581 [Trichonephila clavipes]|nr:hypothetical protein TNCV_3195581 [Trichonephila clavipes]